MKVENGKTVSLSYVLKYDNAEGELIETIDASHPMSIEIGAEDLLETFEEKIMNLSAGDEFEFILTPEEAYGIYDKTYVASVPRNEIMADGEVEEDPICIGNIIPLNDEEGNEYEALILDVKEGIITLDFNHPLAGETLYFKGKIEAINE